MNTTTTRGTTMHRTTHRVLTVLAAIGLLAACAFAQPTAQAVPRDTPGNCDLDPTTSNAQARVNVTCWRLVQQAKTLSSKYSVTVGGTCNLQDKDTADYLCYGTATVGRDYKSYRGSVRVVGSSHDPRKLRIALRSWDAN